MYVNVSYVKKVPVQSGLRVLVLVKSAIESRNHASNFSFLFVLLLSSAFP